jgi:hypothetical protein
MASRVDLEAELAALVSLSPAQLREKWSAATGRPLPRVSPQLLRLALAWELQASVHGGLPRRTSQKLAQLAAARSVTREAQAGMRLVREWGGKVHVVTIGEDKTIRLYNSRRPQANLTARTPDQAYFDNLPLAMAA